METLVVQGSNLCGFDVTTVYFADNIVWRCPVYVLFDSDFDVFASLYAVFMSTEQTENTSADMSPAPTAACKKEKAGTLPKFCCKGQAPRERGTRMPQPTKKSSVLSPVDEDETMEEEEDEVKESTDEEDSEEEEEDEAVGNSNGEEEEGEDGAGEKDFESDSSMDGNMQTLRRIVGRGLHPKKGGTKK